MNEQHTPDERIEQAAAVTEAPRKGRGRLSAVALVAGGMLAGGILAGTMTAGATTTDGETDSDATTTDCGPRGHVERLDEETAAQVEAAVLAEYPDAEVRHSAGHLDDGYVAHIVTADGEHLLVTLDESFAVTGEKSRDDLPGPGRFLEELDDETAAQVEAAVLAEYPDAEVRHTGGRPDGGYVAHIVTADDQRLLVALDEDFTVTGEATGRDVLRRGLHRLHDRWHRMNDQATEIPGDEATAQTSGLTFTV